MRSETSSSSIRKCLPQLRNERTDWPTRRVLSSLALPCARSMVWPVKTAACSRRMTMEGPSGMAISLRSDDIVTTEGEHERCALGDQEHFCRWRGSPRHYATSDRKRRGQRSHAGATVFSYSCWLPRLRLPACLTS